MRHLPEKGIIHKQEGLTVCKEIKVDALIGI